MKVIIAGSRQITDFESLKTVINKSQWEIEQVLSGGCRGVDTMGEQWAQKNDVPVKQFPANWTEYGRTAGEIRNREMARDADGLILLWDGKSPGASCMLREANKEGILTHTQIYGFDMDDLKQNEQDILNHYWHRNGRLVFLNGHWGWEDPTPLMPKINAFSVESLIRRRLMEVAEMKVLIPLKKR